MGGFFFSAIGIFPSLLGDDGIRLAASRARSASACIPQAAGPLTGAAL